MNRNQKKEFVLKSDNTFAKEHIQISDSWIGIPRSVPKLDHTLKVDIIDFLQTFIHTRGVKSVDYTLFSDIAKLKLQYDPQLLIKHLFPEQELEIRNRIWSSLIRAQEVFILEIETFILPSFIPNPNFMDIARKYSDQCKDIRFLEKCDFEDKNFIMGRLFLAKALAQHLQIRCARTKMCEIAQLTRIQKFKLRKTLSNTMNDIAWWLTPKAEEAVRESLWGAALNLESTLLTADHALLFLFSVKDYYLVCHYILRLLLFLQSSRSQKEVELIKQFYIDMCCGINLSNVKGVIPYTFYNYIKGLFTTTTLSNEKDIICKLGVVFIKGLSSSSVITKVYSTLFVEGKQTRMSHSLQCHRLACRCMKELLSMPHCQSNGFWIDCCYPQHQQDHYSNKVMRKHGNVKALSSFNPDTNIQDWAHFIAQKTELMNKRGVNQQEKDIRLKYFQPFTLAHDDNTSTFYASESSGLDTTSDREDHSKRKKVLTKRQNPKNISIKDYASDSDDDSGRDNCEGPLVDTSSTFCVYYRHQVPAFSLDEPEDLWKVSLDDIEVLKHEHICPEQMSNPLLECKPRPSQVYTTDTDSGSDNADL